MSVGRVLITEKYGSLGDCVHYASRENVRIERLTPRKTISRSFIEIIKSALQDVLLPNGYPDSVSEDYMKYQIWDTVQAFCSTITGSFTTRAILKGVGVGNAEANAISAAITWILKDGTGMIGRIVFAWWIGSGLDCNCKKWRLFADFLNDGAMLIELFLPYFSEFSTSVLCVTSTMKSIVGIAGGATRAAITSHQAVVGNMADISAKDGSQETVVNLVASLFSIYLLNSITHPLYELLFIMFMMLVHLYANYKAVTSLLFKNLNDQRLTLLLRSYFVLNTVLNPVKINEKESVILGSGLNMNEICGFKIKLGCSLKNVGKIYNYEELRKLTELFMEKPYLIVVDVKKESIYITFERGETTPHVLQAYFHATLLACATCIYNDIHFDLILKRQRHFSTPITRLVSFMNNIEKNDTSFRSHIPFKQLSLINEFIDQENAMFFTSLNINGWDVTNNSLNLDQWRADWKKRYDKKFN